MVLYVESLRTNVVNFIEVATLLEKILDTVGVEHGGYGESIQICEANLVVLDGLLAAGITEVEVPQKTG